MEKTQKPNNDKEFMRMAMLKHEETFREQVSELHRLYRVQKVLMESVGVSQQQQKPQKLERYALVESSRKGFTIDHYQQQLILQAQAQRDNIMVGLNVMRPDNQALLTSNGGPRPSEANEHIAESNGNKNNNNNNNNKLVVLDEGDEIELTLSLGPSSFNPRRPKNGKSESGQSLSSSSTGSSQTRKTSPKNNTNNRSSMTTTTWAGFPQGSGIEPGFSNSQQNNNPPWLYQALSLKLT